MFQVIDLSWRKKNKEKRDSTCSSTSAGVAEKTLLGISRGMSMSMSMRIGGGHFL
jgi:hypothetical protein